MRYVDPSGHCATCIIPESSPNYPINVSPGVEVEGAPNYNDEFEDILFTIEYNANAFPPAISGPVKAFSGVKGFVGNVVRSLRNIGKSAGKVEEVIQVTVTLSKKEQKHLLNGHMPERYAKQVPHVSKETFEKYLEDNTFFNPSWSEETILEGVKTAYGNALKSGSKGTYDYYYNGEYIRLFINEDGGLGSAYGLNKLDESYFGK